MLGETTRRLATAGLLATAAASCGGTGVTPINDPSTGASDSGGGAYFKAKCKSDIGDCMADARQQCEGAFTVIQQESHAGGMLADALPGPVTWYTVTFRCGATAEETVVAAQQDALSAFVMPNCRSDWEGRCGLLTDKLDHGASIDAPALAIESVSAHDGGGLIKIAAHVCDERADRLSGSCLTEFARSFVKSLQKRYPQAQDQRLLSWCEKHPADCDPSHAEKLRLLELDFLAAHDRAVFARFEQTTGAAARQQSADVSRALTQQQRAGEEESMRRTREELVRAAVEEMNRR